MRSHAGTPHGSRIPEEWPREAELPAFVCTNCGFWQKFFETPSSCPICTDYRHVLPADGWSFLGLEEARGRGRCLIEEVEPGMWCYRAENPLGIASSGYVVELPGGNVGFEGTGWYDEEALEHIESIGGISYLSASHPHCYGALWQLRERFDPEVILQADDLPWATAFPPTWIFDEKLRLGDDAELVRTGGHFAGHTILYLPERRIVFVGDALKFEIDPDDGRLATGVSTHKAFVRRIPLTPLEAGRYREIFASLDFDQAWTPFDQCRNVGRKEILAFLDAQLEGRPFVDAVPL